MNEDIKRKIEQGIKSFSQGNLTQNALNLFQTLGYSTDRQAPLAKPILAHFKESFASVDSRFNEEKAQTKEWKYVDLLFQLSKEEVLRHTSLFDTKQVDRTIIESYLFFVIELTASEYSRTALSHTTREVNRLFPMPVMILFKYGSLLTLSVINRRLHKRDEAKDVLEKVTLIKDIQIESPHRAHIEILFDLSFDELLHAYELTNFVELHNAWQKTLDTKELNRRFFQELANWYFWATQRVVFPDDAEKNKEIRNATNVIRLITRLMFVWFLKERGLVPEELFDERKLKPLLKWGDDKKSAYYKAILQNLFFATLNTEMGKRRFRTKNDEGRDGHHFIHNVFRYQAEFHKPEDVLEKYFAPIPFLNGGLFECLDREIDENGKRKRIRIDGFSDRDDNVLKVPDELFFCENEKDIDLNEIYGTKNKHYKVRGLINVLSTYKFTITENTPIEEEVALDPELLGRVFENLLANYNPETQTTARKQTGSFYTPREIVNYMVDESLIACLKQKIEGGSSDTKEENLREVLSYSEKPNPFDTHQTESLVDAIDSIKILDPACGSGAFPMGILHKLVHILHKIDPKNTLWKQKQVEKAEKIDDASAREAAVETIEEAFERNELDYGRKLYLIENCIYGVDIQAIAAQIAKLRFFISLIVDQTVKLDQKERNYNIRPLPNLETKFVAANTLVDLGNENANLFTNPLIDRKKQDLAKIRHEYFEARTPKRKEACRLRDKQLREELAALLVDEHNLQPANAKLLAGWNPYDQNASASFFDMLWMFGVKEGVDVVIGNPPYGAKFTEDEKEYFKKNYKHQDYQPESFLFFTEKSFHFLKNQAVLSFIIPNTWLTNLRLVRIRKYLTGANTIQSISHYHKSVFDAVVDTEVVLITKGFIPNHFVKVFNHVDTNQLQELKHNQNKWKEKNGDVINIFTNDRIEKVVESLQVNSTTLGAVADVYAGVVPYEEGKGTPPQTRKMMNGKVYNSESKIDSSYKKVLRGSDINKYQNNWDGKRWIKYGSNLAAPRRDEIFNNPKIVVRQTGDSLIATYDDKKFISLKNTHVINHKPGTDLKYILALINSSLLNFYFQYLNPETGEALAEVKKENVEKLLFKKPEEEKPFIILVDYILLLKKHKRDSTFFERLIDAMVYEVYLPEALQATGCEVLKHLTNLPALREGKDESNLKVIEKVYKELSGPNHPVNGAMFKMDTIDEIRIIEGKQ